MRDPVPDFAKRRDWTVAAVPRYASGASTSRLVPLRGRIPPNAAPISFPASAAVGADPAGDALDDRLFLADEAVVAERAAGLLKISGFAAVDPDRLH